MLIDAFMFYDELDLLEIRLHEMDSIADKFVIVESLERHGSVKPKAATLRENWHRVTGFEHKIKYILLDKLIPPYTDEDSAYGRENYQREATFCGALSLSKSRNDLIIISDVDEIPRAKAIQSACQDGRLWEKGLHHLLQDFFYYNVNCFLYDDWNPALIGTVSQILDAGGAERARRAWHTPHVLHHGGWHFSYFGGVQKIRTKLESYLHSGDVDSKEILRRSDAQLAAEIALGTNIYHGRTKLTWRESNDPRLPEYFLNNRDKFKYLTAGQS